MEKSLNARFAESHGAPIVLDGMTVHIVYNRAIREGERFVVEFLSWSGDRAQGINLRAKDGLLVVNDTASSVLSLWVDTAPPLVEVICAKSPREGLLMVSNQWRRDDGVEDEWTNNAGMILEEHDDGVVLRCSDGIGPPSFDDLVVDLRFPAS